jgi:proline racemase
MAPVRAILLCLLVASLAISAMPGEAAAARKKVSSSASLESVSADGVSGKVDSQQGACRAGRTVTVYMLNTSSPATAVPFGTTFTSGDGTWSIDDWAYPGQYYAVVEAKKTRHFVCQTATSNSKAWWTSGAAS